LDAIVRWWHAGEEHVVSKYEHRNSFEIVLYVIFVGALWLLLPQYRLIPIILGLLSLPQIIAERRIALIFSPTEVIYRPPLGSPHHVKFEHILEIRNIRVLRHIGGTFSGAAPGVALRILGTETARWWLPFPDRDHILNELSRMAGKPSNEAIEPTDGFGTVNFPTLHLSAVSSPRY
jgi:hypothetical protein